MGIGISEPTPLGLFSKLPFEVRERIWLEFTPAGQDTSTRYTSKTDLNILFTSQYLYNEITATIYHRSSLSFNITPTYLPDENWMTASYSHQHYLMEDSDRDNDNATAKWIFKNLPDAKYRGFGKLPLHKIDNVIVNILAPNNTYSQLFCLWKKVSDLVKLLDGEREIHSLTINLKNHGIIDWFYQYDDEYFETNWELYDQPDEWRAHDMLITPFCTLRNLKGISVHVDPHPEHPERDIDRRAINNFLGIVLNQTWDDHIKGRPIDYFIARDYFILHRDLWQHEHSLRGNILRLGILRNWFVRKDGGWQSEFEEQIERIVERYPQIIRSYDPGMEFVSSIHQALVCLYEEARQTAWKNSLNQYWNTGIWGWNAEIWEWRYPTGIPPCRSRAFSAFIKPKLDWDYYSVRVGRGGLLGRMYPVLMELRGQLLEENEAEEQVDSDDQTDLLSVSNLDSDSWSDPGFISDAD